MELLVSLSIVVHLHKKYEAILGSVESVEYLEELDKKVEKQLRENF